MDTEIQEIFNNAMEPREMEAAPEQETVEQLRRALEEERSARSAAEDAARSGAILDCTVQAAIAGSGARDPELLRLLLEREGLSVEDGAVKGLSGAIDAIRQSRPYLFQDAGGRPRFSAATMDRGLCQEEETVAMRYRNNPWYRRK